MKAGCLMAAMLIVAVVGCVAWLRWGTSDGRPPESAARHLPFVDQRDLPLDEYGLAELCPAMEPSPAAAVRKARLRRAVEFRALVRQLEKDRDVAVLATFTLADVDADKAKVRQWTSLEDLTRTHIDALRQNHCAPAAARRLRRLLR